MLFKNNKYKIKISKKLIYILRHKAIYYGLILRSDGYIELNYILNLSEFFNISIIQIKDIVSSDDKQRFSIIYENDILFIRANQGHSISNIIDNDLLIKIDNPYSISNCVHGTYFHAWNNIKQNGLNIMSRNNIHFSNENTYNNNGIRSNIQIKIYINVEYAMNIGVLFFCSTNNVILSSGINGNIPISCFLYVIDIINNTCLI
jgi:2'-phosphotransferase